MIVIVRQAGDDRKAPKIHQTRIRACECSDCSISPHGDIQVAPHGKRLSNRKAWIDRNDFAVVVDRVMWRVDALLRVRILRDEQAQEHKQAGG